VSTKITPKQLKMTQSRKSIECNWESHRITSKQEKNSLNFHWSYLLIGLGLKVSQEFEFLFGLVCVFFFFFFFFFFFLRTLFWAQNLCLPVSEWVRKRFSYDSHEKTSCYFMGGKLTPHCLGKCQQNHPKTA